MAERNADDADFAVDELKRRARRRLVGAIVLALAAAVILPLLLETEPKPLGDDVSVQIPPVDDGRFVNRLTGRNADSKSSAKPLSKSAPPAKTEPPPASAPAPVSAPSATSVDNAVAPAAAPTSVPPPRKSVAEAEQKVLSGGAATTVAAKPDAPRAAATPEATDAPVAAAPPASAEGFAVQIAAFTDDKGANALAGKLKKAGYATTYTEPVETSRGTLWRVRVGGYATRPDADEARAKLKNDGWNGIVVSAR